MGLCFPGEDGCWLKSEMADDHRCPLASYYGMGCGNETLNAGHVAWGI